jgi:phosphate-selective porin
MSKIGLATLAGLVAVAPASAEFRIGTSGESSLRISGRVQVRYTGWDQSGAEENSFQIRQARLRLDGDAFPHVTYEVQLDADASSGSNPLRLRDANLVFNYHPWLQLKAGQFKTPFGAEQLTTSDRLHSLDRALLDALTPARQLGIMLSSAPDSDVLSRGSTGHKLDYAVGYFNGNGVNRAGNDNRSGMAVARIVAAPDAGKSFGAHFFTSKDAAVTASDQVGLALPGRRNGYGFDVHIRQGPLSLRAELAELRFDPEPQGEDGRTRRGFYIQPTYQVMKDRVELWYRYDYFDPDTDLEDNSDKRWSHVGINYFVRGHQYKVQAEYVARRERGTALEDDRFLVQLQVAW